MLALPAPGARMNWQEKIGLFLRRQSRHDACQEAALPDPSNNDPSP